MNEPFALKVTVPFGVAPLNGTTVGVEGPSMSAGTDLVSMLEASAIDATPANVAPATCSCVLPAVLYVMVGVVSIGGSLTGVTVIVKVSGADVSTPPLAVPPLSCRTQVIVGRAVGVRRRRVGQHAGRRDRRRGR